MDNKTIECSVCSGKGFIPCKTCGGNTTVKCPDCGGEGREYKIICQTCHKGYVTDTRSLDDDKTLCPDCHGNYREDLGPCKKCDGKGVLSCETCNGTGKTECMVCKGKGKISFWDFIEVVYPKDVDEFVRKYSKKPQSSHEVPWRYVYLRARSMFKVHDVTREIWKLLANAANRKDGDAAFVLGMCYAQGVYYGDKRDVNYEGCADLCFAISAEAGNGYGQFMFGCKCLYYYDVRSSSEKTINRWKYSINNLHTIGFKWIEDAGNNNVVPALVELALHNLDGCLNGYSDASSALRYCSRILDIKKQGGVCGEVFYEFAKAHVGFLKKAIPKKSRRALKSAGNEMKKWWSAGERSPSYAYELASTTECYREFVRIGIFFGLFGLQFAYARRWKFFFAHWAALIATLFFPPSIIVCLAFWLGSILFMKRAGRGYLMK